MEKVDNVNKDLKLEIIKDEKLEKEIREVFETEEENKGFISKLNVVNELKRKGRLYIFKDKRGNENGSRGEIDLTGKGLWYPISLTPDETVALRLSETTYFAVRIVEIKPEDETKQNYYRVLVSIDNSFERIVPINGYQAQQNFKKLLSIK